MTTPSRNMMSKDAFLERIRKTRPSSFVHICEVIINDRQHIDPSDILAKAELEEQAGLSKELAAWSFSKTDSCVDEIKRDVPPPQIRIPANSPTE